MFVLEILQRYMGSGIVVLYSIVHCKSLCTLASLYICSFLLVLLTCQVFEFKYKSVQLYTQPDVSVR